MKQYCMDCGYYIPGGGEHNCSLPRAKTAYFERNVSALKDACRDFKDRDKPEDLSAYPKINLRAKRRIRKQKD